MVVVVIAQRHCGQFPSTEQRATQTQDLPATVTVDHLPPCRRTSAALPAPTTRTLELEAYDIIIRVGPNGLDKNPNLFLLRPFGWTLDNDAGQADTGLMNLHSGCVTF